MTADKPLLTLKHGLQRPHEDCLRPLYRLAPGAGVGGTHCTVLVKRSRLQPVQRTGMSASPVRLARPRLGELRLAETGGGTEPRAKSKRRRAGKSRYLRMRIVRSG